MTWQCWSGEASGRSPTFPQTTTLKLACAAWMLKSCLRAAASRPMPVSNLLSRQKALPGLPRQRTNPLFSPFRSGQATRQLPAERQGQPLQQQMLQRRTIAPWLRQAPMALWMPNLMSQERSLMLQRKQQCCWLRYARK